MNSTPAASPRIDLRSDTVTKPEPGMLAAMAAAEVGDDVYGEDPTVNALQAEVAARFGHQAGLFVPTGSLANALAVRVLVPAGRELLSDRLAHVVRAELGVHAVLGHALTRTWATQLPGRLSAAAALDLVSADGNPYLVQTAALSVENTHNFGGGLVQPIEELRALAAGARRLGLRVHLDGARIWNAHIATDVPLAEYGACADLISVCLSKGLGAPVGSLLLGSTELIDQARWWRKCYGGGWRQAGLLAAAGRYAIEHNLPRLADDHRRARRLAEVAHAIDPARCDPRLVESNMVLIELGPDRLAADFVAAAAAVGIAVSAVARHTIRLVTHLQFTDDHLDRVELALGALLALT